MEGNAYLSAKDVSEILGVSKSKAYQIIRELNQELIQKGYSILSGKIAAQYLEEKFYGLVVEQK